MTKGWKQCFLIETVQSVYGISTAWLPWSRHIFFKQNKFADNTKTELPRSVILL
jgi:hypothetical protein